MKQQPETFWDRLDRFTPGFCRIIARHKRGLPLTSQEISVGSGYELTPHEVFLMSFLDNWDQVPIGRLRAFLRGCGIDLCDYESMNRIGVYLKARSFNPKSRFKYLTKSPEWETVFKPILKTLTDRWGR